jgi:RecJ-like exonuclease
MVLVPCWECEGEGTLPNGDPCDECQASGITILDATSPLVDEYFKRFGIIIGIQTNVSDTQ